MGVFEIDNNDDFEKLVLNSNENSIVDFFATWCKPCKKVAPHYENLSNEYDNVNFYKINIENKELRELIFTYNIRKFPSFLYFKNNTNFSMLQSSKIDEIKLELNRMLNEESFIQDDF